MLWKIAIIAAFAVSFVAFLVYEIVTAQEVDDDGNLVIDEKPAKMLAKKGTK